MLMSNVVCEAAVKVSRLHLFFVAFRRHRSQSNSNKKVTDRHTMAGGIPKSKFPLAADAH